MQVNPPILLIDTNVWLGLFLPHWLEHDEQQSSSRLRLHFDTPSRQQG